MLKKCGPRKGTVKVLFSGIHSIEKRTLLWLTLLVYKSYNQGHSKYIILRGTQPEAKRRKEKKNYMERAILALMKYATILRFFLRMVESYKQDVKNRVQLLQGKC